MRIYLSIVVLTIILCSCNTPIDSEISVRNKYPNCEISRVGRFQGTAVNAFIVFDNKNKVIRYVDCTNVCNSKITADYIIFNLNKNGNNN